MWKAYRVLSLWCTHVATKTSEWHWGIICSCVDVHASGQSELQQTDAFYTLHCTSLTRILFIQGICMKNAVKALLFCHCNDTRQSAVWSKQALWIKHGWRYILCFNITVPADMITAVSEGTPFPEFNFWKWSSICPVLLCSVLSCCCQTEPDILILGVYWSWNRWYIFENVTKAGAISCDVGNLGI